MQRKALILVIFLTALISSKLPIQSDVGTLDIPKVTKSATTTEPFKNSTNLVTITRIIDGDTIVANINDTNEKIRLIGVNTPETVDPRKPVQCFGKEASAFTKNLLKDNQIRLESDPSQGDRDKYGRLLRYVFLSDNTLVNREIIAQGYGHEYTYRTPYHYQKDFKIAERSARKTNHGLWSPTACPTNP